MIASLWLRYERLARFILVGAAITFIYSILTVGIIASRLVENRVWASLIASLIVIPISFLAHRAVTYKDATRISGQWTRFLLIGTLNVLINISVMQSSEMFGLPVWSALAIGWVIVPVINFTLTTLWIFRPRGIFRLF